jgi:hypothetical protein
MRATAEIIHDLRYEIDYIEQQLDVLHEQIEPLQKEYDANMTNLTMYKTQLNYLIKVQDGNPEVKGEE